MLCRQLQVYPQVREQDGVKFSFWLVLLDVELLAAEDLPFVRCSMTVINQVDRSRDVPSSAPHPSTDPDFWPSPDSLSLPGLSISEPVRVCTAGGVQ